MVKCQHDGSVFVLIMLSVAATAVRITNKTKIRVKLNKFKSNFKEKGNGGSKQKGKRGSIKKGN